MRQNPRIVCVGSNLESREVLEGLLAMDARVVGLVTKPAGRGGATSDYVDLHGLCESSGIRVIDTEDINSSAVIEAIATLHPEYLFTLGWSQLFGADLLAVPCQFAVGSHPTLLPDGRGRAPVPWSILRGLRQSAVSVFRMDPGVDSGPLLKQRPFEIPARVYAGDLYAIVARELRAAYCELYSDLARGCVIETPQDSAAASYWARRVPEDGRLDFSRKAADVDCLVRAVSRPFPGAYSYYSGELVRIWKADLVGLPRYHGVPGQILLRDGGRLLVQAGDHPLWLWELTADGGTVKEATSFKIGSRFGYRVEDELHLLRREVERLRIALERR